MYRGIYIPGKSALVARARRQDVDRLPWLRPGTLPRTTDKKTGLLFKRSNPMTTSTQMLQYESTCVEIGLGSNLHCQNKVTFIAGNKVTFFAGQDWSEK